MNTERAAIGGLAIDYILIKQKNVQKLYSFHIFSNFNVFFLLFHNVEH